MGAAGGKQGRGDVSDAQWAMIAPLLPEQKRGGRWNDHRVTFDGMLWVMRTGAPWRDLPERYGKWQSVHHRFNRWRKDGTIDKVLKALRIRLDKNGHIDWDLWCVDGTCVLASRSAAGASKKAKNQAGDTGTTRWARRPPSLRPRRRACSIPGSVWTWSVPSFHDERALSRSASKSRLRTALSSYRFCGTRVWIFSSPKTTGLFQKLCGEHLQFPGGATQRDSELVSARQKLEHHFLACHGPHPASEPEDCPQGCKREEPGPRTELEEQPTDHNRAGSDDHPD